MQASDANYGNEASDNKKNNRNNIINNNNNHHDNIVIIFGNFAKKTAAKLSNQIQPKPINC